MGAILSFITWFIGGDLIPEENDPEKKFVPCDGITLYDNGPSPCARRVRMTLIEKKKKWRKVTVDLMKGEQKATAYKKINPNGKVPAIAFQNVEGVPDGTLYESNVITEYLDRLFPNNPLYPSDPWERAQVRMWQDWEQSIAEDMVPIVYHNMMPFVLRMIHSSREDLMKKFSEGIPDSLRRRYINLYDGVREKTDEELKVHAAMCYRRVLELEHALEGKEFLVGDRFTMADLSVYPRVAMFTSLDLPISKKHFPNVDGYFSRLCGRKCFRESEDRQLRLAAFLSTYMPWLVVFVGNWKSGKTHERFDCSQVLDRVLGEENEVRPTTSLEKPAGLILWSYPFAAELWQARVILLEKSVDFLIDNHDFMALIGRPLGSGEILCVQNGDKTVAGARAMLEYLDSTTGSPALLPSSASERAAVQCWQAWEQAMYAYEMYLLLERCLINKMLQDRFPEEKLDDLLNLRSDPLYSSRFLDIMRIYLQGLDRNSGAWSKLSVDYGHLAESEEKTTQLTKDVQTALHLRLIYLNEKLQDKDFLVGERLTLADVCVYSRLLLMPFAGMKISGQKYPHVISWMNQLKTVASFASITRDVSQKLEKFI